MRKMVSKFLCISMVVIMLISSFSGCGYKEDKESANYSDTAKSDNKGYPKMQSEHAADVYYEEEFNTEEYNAIVENSYKSVKNYPMSTFSVDVDTASYSNIRRMINDGGEVVPDAVRIEEMINYFKYDYEKPTTDVPFSINTEMSDCPWNENAKLLLIGLQAKEIDLDNRPSSNLVFLLDVSGSMNSPDKLPLMQKAFIMLTENLNENDRISIVTYAGMEKVVQENLGDSNISFVNRNLLNEESVEIFQYSLVVKDISKLKSVMTNLNNNGYNGLSSFLANENVDRNLPGELMIISIGFGIYAIFLLIIVYLFSYLSIRTILLSGKKNYNIFRVLGVSPKEIQIMSGIEVVICFFSAYLFNLILFVLFKHLNVKYVSDFVANIKFSGYMLLLVVNIILSFFVANRYSKLLAKRSLMATVKVGG